MAALQAPVATVIENIYTKKTRYIFRNSKDFNVTTIVKDQAAGELEMKIQIPYIPSLSYHPLLFHGTA